MGRKPGKGDEEEDGETLWADYARDIKPIRDRAASVAAGPAKPTPVKPAPSASGGGATKTAPKTAAPRGTAQLDGSTESKLKKGKIAIEGRLDLHGYTQAQAQDALEAFVLRAAKTGKRCLLVITGKGLSKGEGVLRARLPQWIALSPLSDVVLKAVHAAPKDGGTGAFYLYLKRQR